MFVELDVFSGRPNPRWELDQTHSQKLWQLQGRLEVSRRVHPEPPGLGRVRAYRGFILTAHAVLADPSFIVERYLIDQLPDEFAALRTRISSEIARPE